MGKTIDVSEFQRWFLAIAERFGRTFSENSLDLYHELLGEKLTTEEFVMASKALFVSADLKTMPAVEDWVKMWRDIKAAQPSTDSPTEDNIQPGKPENFEEIKAKLAIELARARLMHHSRSGLTSLGSAIADVRVGGIEVGSSLDLQIEQYRQWLQDPVLANEAIAWVHRTPGIHLTEDEDGKLDIVVEDDDDDIPF